MLFIHNTLKNRVFLVTLILFAIGWVNFNISFFSHYHVTEDGMLIIHAHPYHKKDTQSNPYPNHVHTKSELILLAITIQTSAILILYFLYNFLVNKNKRLKQFTTFVINPKHLFCYKISRRGPPLNLQLS